VAVTLVFRNGLPANAGIPINFTLDGNLFNIRRLQAKPKSHQTPYSTCSMQMMQWYLVTKQSTLLVTTAIIIGSKIPTAWPLWFCGSYTDLIHAEATVWAECSCQTGSTPAQSVSTVQWALSLDIVGVSKSVP